MIIFLVQFLGYKNFMVKIITWNINSIRSRTNHLLDLIKNEEPDLLLLQEIKCEDHSFPYSLFEGHYNIKIHGQKSYNGVAIFSKFPIDDLKISFPNNICEDQARFIEISCNTTSGYSRIISLYAPNGSEVGSDKFLTKLNFFNHFIKYLEDIKSIEENVIIGGDFNIAPFDIDVYSPDNLASSVCYTLEERHKMRTILNIGYQDLYRLYNQSKQEYSWWDYRNQGFQKNLGMRIDTIIANPLAANKLSNCYINSTYREQEKPSDHAPVVAIFE